MAVNDTRNIVPRGDNEGALGTPSRRWNNVNAVTFTGNLSGMAVSAVSCDKLDGYHVSTTNEANTIPVRNSNGELVSDTSQANSQNLLINGDLGIWQRGTTSTSTGYLADRWKITDNLGTSEGSVQRTTVDYITDVVTALSDTFKYGIKIERTGIADPTSLISITQAVESNNCRYLNGKSITLSFWAKKLGGGADITLEPKLLLGSGEDDANANSAMVDLQELNGSTSVGEHSGAIEGSGSWQRYSYTWNMGLVTTWKSLRVKMEVNTAVGSPATGGFDITGIQLEGGWSKTNFDHENVAEQITKCQRYYEVMTGMGTKSVFSDDCYAVAYFQKKRVIPSITLHHPTSGLLGYGLYETNSGNYNVLISVFKISDTTTLFGWPSWTPPDTNDGWLSSVLHIDTEIF